MRKTNGLPFYILIICTIMTMIAQAQFLVKTNGSNITTVQTPAGRWQFSLFPRGIVKTTYLPKNSTHNEQVSDAVILNAERILPKIANNQSQTILTWGNGTMLNISPSGINYNLSNGEIIQLTRCFASESNRGFSFGLQPDEMIFGAGERSTPLNRRGYSFQLYNAPAYGYELNAERLNFSVPFVLSSRKYAILFDNPSKGYLDIGKTDSGTLEYGVLSGELSFYIIPGKYFDEILSNYHKLTGTQALPPRWAMGNFMSRFGYQSEQQTREIFGKMKEDKIPFDAVIFDLFWFGDSIKGTLGNLDWVNKTAWPNPQKMIADFKKEGVESILITEPYVLQSTPNYLPSKNYHATDSAGNPYVLTDFYFGHGGLIDMFRKDAQEWFWSKYKAQMDNGVTGWWGDLGEPEKHPANIYHNLKDLGFERRFSADEVHNIYGYYWSKMVYTHFKRDYPGKRLFHLNRSGYPGSQRYGSFPWSGDVNRSWGGLQAQLPLIQSTSLSGIPYIHSDAGGFAMGEVDDELYIRWMQFAAFTPVFRPHGTALGAVDPLVKNIPSEPAMWPDKTKALAKAAADLRYEWLPYNYTLSYEQARYGKLLVKPMFFLSENDSNLYEATGQYLWGDNVIVVPITQKEQHLKTYYVPEGEWVNVFTQQSFTGPQWVNDSISINHIPVLAKAGSFIPRKPGLLNTNQYNSRPLDVLYLPSPQASQYTLYEDDGADANAIANGSYELISFRSMGLKRTTHITVQSNSGTFKGRPVRREMMITIPNLTAKPLSVLVDGKKVTVEERGTLSNGFISIAEWKPSAKTLRLPILFTNKKVEAVIKF
jgi:oligosaccharide 4-alpha-D-glucosyltransferase